MPHRLDPFGPVETRDPVIADERNFYKVERWSEDDLQIEELLYAGNQIERARGIFDDAIMQQPKARYYIRQRARVLSKWPQ